MYKYQSFLEKLSHDNWSIDDSLINKILNEIGYNDFTFIDKGFYGIALDVGDDKVVKITRDKSEALNANFLRKYNTKCLINYYDVRELKFNDVNKYVDEHLIKSDYAVFPQLYILVMDKVNSLSRLDHIRFQFVNRYDLVKMDDVKFVRWKENHMKNEIARYPHYYFVNDNERKEFIEREDLIIEMKDKIKAIRKECYNLGLSGDDMHEDNVGWKEDGTLVFFDLGVNATDRKNKTLKPITI